MRAWFGAVSLLVVLAVVGLLVTRSLKSAAPVTSSFTPDAAVPGASPIGTAAERQRLQQRFKADIERALEQGAASRADAVNE